jgi:spermidine synthase
LNDAEEDFRPVLECEPFVYRTEETLSLHFDLSVIQSEMRCDAPHELVLPYTQTMMGFLLFNPRPKKLFMIGLGGGSLAKYCYAKLPDASIVVAEINPQVIALRRTFAVPADDERFRVICQDGADFVRKTSESCDVLLVDGFDIVGRSPQLCSQRFFDDCYRQLAPGGLVVVNLGGHHLDPHEIIERMQRAFASSVIVVESDDFANRIAFVRKGATLRLTREQFISHLGQLETHHGVSLRSALYRIQVACRMIDGGTLAC